MFEDVQISVGGVGVVFKTLFVYVCVHTCWRTPRNYNQISLKPIYDLFCKDFVDIIIFTFRKKKNISLSQLKNHPKMNHFLSSLVFQPSPPPFWRLVLAKSPSQPILTVPSFCFPLFYRRLKWKTLDFLGGGSVVRFGVGVIGSPAFRPETPNGTP